jgi:hypothetical protein
MRLRAKKLKNALRSALLLSVAVCLFALSAGRFGLRQNSGQCPTAPVQQVAIMVRHDDGSFTREFRAPHPGEKDFVVCHCQERQAAQQSTLVAVTYPVAMLSLAAELVFPRRIHIWQEPGLIFQTPTRPFLPLIHPPAA